MYQTQRWQETRLDILARDGWQCGLCGQLIDPDARPGSSLAACVDHIVPTLEGGAFFDPANLRAAHIRCNSQRVGWRKNRRATRRYQPRHW